MTKFDSFNDFYPYYLQEHKNRTCRRLHFIGSVLVLLLLLSGIITGNSSYFIMTPIAGYGFAWVGHFFFENNRPATFKHPLYSFMGDWKMFGQTLTGRLRF